MNNLVPGCVPFPGIFANYGAGRLRAFLAVIWHYTVGVNSLLLLANNGLCAFLIAGDGTIYQMGPWDGVNYTQCEWNIWAQGIEVESLDGSITDAQIASLGYLTIFLLGVGEIPWWFYDGERIPVGSPIAGVTNHRNLHQNACAEHYDGFGQEVWDAINAPPPTPPEPEPIPVPPPPPDPNEGDDDLATGPKRIKWHPAAGVDAVDRVLVTDDGTVWIIWPTGEFTTAGVAKYGHFPIAGPQAALNSHRYKGKIKVDTRIEVIITDGLCQFEVQADSGTGATIIECYFNPADDAAADGSKWRSRPLGADTSP